MIGRVIAFGLAFAIVGCSLPAFADPPRAHATSALDIVIGIQKANVSNLAGSIIGRSLPGGNTLVTNNNQLRQPNKQQLAERAAVYRDLPSIRQHTSIRPVQNKTDIAHIRRRLRTIVQRMRKNRSVTRRDLEDYANAMSPLYVYERDLSQQQRLAKLRRGQPIRVFPGEKIVVAYHGNCTDHNLPAPGANEEVYFRTVDAIFPKPLQPVMSDVVRYGARHSGYPTQAVVWFVRGLGGSNFDATQYGYMGRQIDLAHPGGWSVVSGWAQQQASIAARKQFFTSLALNILGRTGIDLRLTNALLSTQDLMRQFQGSEPAQIAHLVSQQMHVINGMQPSAARPDDMSALSRVHGFDAVAMANGLQVQGVLYNAQPSPLIFDPSAPMIAEAERPTQRAFGVPDSAGFPDHQDVDPSLQNDVAKTMRDGLHDLIDSPAGKLINGVVKGADDACTLFGLRSAAGGFFNDPLNFLKGFHLYEGAQGVLNVFKVAATGTDMDGNSAPPVQRFMDLLLAGGAVGAAITVAPEIAASLGIEAGMTATEALASALNAAGDGIAGLADGAADAEFADDPSWLDRGCSLVAGPATISAGGDVAENPSANAWGNFADHLLELFHVGH